MKKAILFTMAILAIISKASAQESRRQWHQREAFQTETPMVHDPVIAKEGDTYYIYATGMSIQQEWEAAGHCAAYTFDGEDIFICHGYSATHNGAAMLIQRPISWTTDGWPELR